MDIASKFGEYPPIWKPILSSAFLISVYFLIAELFKKYPSLGFSVESKGGTNEGYKPNYISYMAAYKFLVIFFQEGAGVLAALLYFKFNMRRIYNSLFESGFGEENVDDYKYLAIIMEQVFLPFWVLGAVHYWFMMGDHQIIRTFHKVFAANGTFIGIKLIHYSPDLLAICVLCAKLCGLLESFATVAHLRGTLYTKPMVTYVFFITAINLIIRFGFEPMLVYQLMQQADLLRNLSYFDYFNILGIVGLVWTHLYFTYKAAIGFPGLITRMKKYESLNSKKE